MNRKVIFIQKDRPSIVWINVEGFTEERIDSMFYHSKYLKNESKLACSGLNIKPLSKIILEMNSPIGWQGIPSSSYLPKGLGVPLIRVQNVDNLFLNEDEIIGVQEYIYETQPAIQAEANDILITRVGTIGRVCIIPNKIKKIAMGQNLTRIKVNSLIITSGFLAIYFCSKYCYLQMEKYAYGGVQSSLTNKNIKELKVIIPSHEIQKYIGDKVRKAERLREEAGKLKREAEYILSDELRFNELDRRLKLEKGKYSWVIPEKLSDRVDGEFYKIDFINNIIYLDSLRTFNIPVLKLEEIMVSGNYGILPSSNDYNKGNILFLRSTNLKEYLIDYEDPVYVPETYYIKKARVNDGDILLEIKGGVSSGAIINNLFSKTIINGSIFKFSVKEHYNNYYILSYLLSKSGQLQKAQNTANSIINYLSIDCIKNLLIPVIEKTKQDKIGDKLKRYQEITITSKQLVMSAKKDVEELIEGNFDYSKIQSTTPESR